MSDIDELIGKAEKWLEEHGNVSPEPTAFKHMRSLLDALRDMQAELSEKEQCCVHALELEEAALSEVARLQAELDEARGELDKYRWVLFSEKLPDVGTEFLVLFSDGTIDHFKRDAVSGEHSLYNMNSNNYSRADWRDFANHWMHLPTTPDKEG